MQKADTETLNTSQSRLVWERAVPHLSHSILFNSWTKETLPLFKQVSLHVVKGKLLVFSEKGFRLSQQHTFLIEAVSSSHLSRVAFRLASAACFSLCIKRVLELQPYFNVIEFSVSSVRFTASLPCFIFLLSFYNRS